MDYRFKFKKSPNVPLALYSLRHAYERGLFMQTLHIIKKHKSALYFSVLARRGQLSMPQHTYVARVQFPSIVGCSLGKHTSSSRSDFIAASVLYQLHLLASVAVPSYCRISALGYRRSMLRGARWLHMFHHETSGAALQHLAHSSDRLWESVRYDY